MPKEKKKAERISGTLTERYPNLEVETTVMPLDANLSCPCCKGKMHATGMTERSEILRVKPKVYYIEIILREKLACNKCYSSIVTAPLPPKIIPGSIYGNDVLIDLAVSKFYELIPIGRLARISKMAGFSFPANSMIECTHFLASFLEIIYDMCREEILREKDLRADESPHKMLEGDEKMRWYLWLFMSKETAYYEAHSTRSGDVCSKLLIESQCETLMSDVFSGYAKSVKAINKVRVESGRPLLENPNCNSHSQRKFKACKANFAEEHEFYCGQYKEIFILENQARKEVGGKEILKIRSQMYPYFEAIKEKCNTNKDSCSTKSDLGIAVNYFLNNYEAFTLFLTNPNIDIDNNAAERGFKSPAIGRKTWYGTHSIRGALTTVIMYTLFESCKLNGTNPRDYMQSIVDSLLKYKGKDWRKEKDFDPKDPSKEWREAYEARKKFAFTPKTYKEMMVSKAPPHPQLENCSSSTG
ncbi:MAG: IS66 family transposase [Bacteriovorax sp.]|nr:IS66 family transposase [Bacteriovorax sp.]